MNVSFNTLASLLTLALFLGCSKTENAQTTETAAPADPVAQPPTPAAAPAPTPAAAPAPLPAVAPAPAAPAAASPLAAGMVRYEAAITGSSSKMEGDSTLHKWKMESKIIGGFIEADANFPESTLTDPKTARPNVSAFMPVRSYKSGNKKMDDIMQDSMNAATLPKIEYSLIELKPTSPAGTAGAIQFEATGALTISGVTRTNTMPVTIEKKDGKLKINGTTPVKMSDYKVKPKLTGPAALLTVDDNLKITFEWMLAPKAN